MADSGTVMRAAAAVLLLSLAAPAAAQDCETVERSAAPLPGDDPAAWRQLLASPTPLLFAAGSASAGGPDGPGQSELQRVAATWSWDRIGTGVGPHVQGFVGQAGARRFPYCKNTRNLGCSAGSLSDRFWFTLLHRRGQHAAGACERQQRAGAQRGVHNDVWRRAGLAHPPHGCARRCLPG